MTIDWDGIKATVTDDVAEAMAQQSAASMAKLPVLAIALGSCTWSGTVIVYSKDELEIGHYIRLDSDGDWFKVINLVYNVTFHYWVATLEDVYGVGIPTGNGATSYTKTRLPTPPALDGSTLIATVTPFTHNIIDGVKMALDQAVINDVADDLGNTVGPGVIV